MTLLQIHLLRLARLIGQLGMVSLLVSCASLSPVVPWYQGVFESAIFGGLGIKVACDGELSCEVHRTTRQGSNPEPSGRLVAGIASPFPPDIPNNNLRDTQQFVASHENWERLPGEEGILLRASRGIVASRAVFSKCIDFDAKNFSGLLLCATDGDTSTQKSPYFLEPSMAPCGAFGSRPYCAYIYIPLSRVR